MICNHDTSEVAEYSQKFVFYLMPYAKVRLLPDATKTNMWQTRMWQTNSQFMQRLISGEFKLSDTLINSNYPSRSLRFYERSLRMKPLQNSKAAFCGLQLISYKFLFANFGSHSKQIKSNNNLTRT